MNETQKKIVQEMLQKLQTEGYRIEKIANEVEVCSQTIYRWKWGQYLPNEKNMKDLTNFWKSVIKKGG